MYKSEEKMIRKKAKKTKAPCCSNLCLTECCGGMIAPCPMCVAVTLLILNICLPGSGTIINGFFGDTKNHDSACRGCIRTVPLIFGLL